QESEDAVARSSHCLDHCRLARRKPRRADNHTGAQGLRLLRNLAVGLIGALIGGLLFRVLGILPALDTVAISLRDVAAAAIGSLLVSTAIGLIQRSKKTTMNFCEYTGGAARSPAFGIGSGPLRLAAATGRTSRQVGREADASRYPSGCYAAWRSSRYSS